MMSLPEIAADLVAAVVRVCATASWMRWHASASERCCGDVVLATGSQEL
jgi:hypothetical protein